MTRIMADRKKRKSVAKIAPPPPRGTLRWEKRPLTGFETKPKRGARIRTRLVRTSEVKKEPTKRTIANKFNWLMWQFLLQF